MIRNIAVRHKFTAVAVLTTTIVVLVSSSVFVALEINNYRRALVQEVAAIAQIMSINSTAAILFGDRAAARETLAALSARPNIEIAALFTPDGNVFARYDYKIVGAGEADRGRPAAAIQAGLGDEIRRKETMRRFAADSRSSFALDWSWQTLDLLAPVRIDKDLVGGLLIRSSLAQIGATVGTYLTVVALIILLSIALAWWLAARLQRQVTLPIIGLLDTIQAVSRDHDYALRAQKHGGDEMGHLVDAFNEMLAETEAHRVELDVAREQAESSNRMKTEFLAHMSHELRTPLNAILGFSDFMLSEPHGPLGHRSYCEYVRDIHDGGQHLLDIINDVLDLSKIEAGAAELNESVIDVRALMQGTIRLLRDSAERAGVGVRIAAAPDLPDLWGDEQLLKRSLLNLLSNAIDFTPAGGQITVRAGARLGYDYVISVADTGAGIAPEHIEHVLTPFGQGENVMTRSHKGTGLGLPLVKSFIELHGGSLQLQSVLGEGTEVTLRLPANRVTSKFAAADEEPARPARRFVRRSGRLAVVPAA